MTADCVPATQEAMKMYPIAYIKSLEENAAQLKQRLNQQVTGAAFDQFYTAQPQSSENLVFDMLPNFQVTDDAHQSQSLYLPPINMTDDYPCIRNSPQEMSDLFPNSEPQLHHQSNMDRGPLAAFVGSPPTQEKLYRFLAESPIDTSVSTIASSFQTYFKVIHPRYPFLDVEDCSNAYLEWKANLVLPRSRTNGWPAFLVKMVLFKHSFSS
jgi:hypothetical protein